MDTIRSHNEVPNFFESNSDLLDKDSCAFCTKPINLRWLVASNDGGGVSSFSCPCCSYAKWKSWVRFPVIHRDSQGFPS